MQTAKKVIDRSKPPTKPKTNEEWWVHVRFAERQYWLTLVRRSDKLTNREWLRKLSLTEFKAWLKAPYEIEDV